jgi:hypothetical protein
MSVAVLEKFAMDHYEAGGHWVVECFGADDYQGYLDQAQGDVGQAQVALQSYWQLVQDRYQDVQAEVF